MFLEVLDLESCLGLHSLPELPPGVDMLIITSCERLQYLESRQLAEGGSLQHAGFGPVSVAVSPSTSDAQHPTAAVPGATSVSAGTSGQQHNVVQTVQEALQALPQSLTEMQVAGCPIFSGTAAQAALSAFLMSNRLLQWGRFREPDALASHAPG